MIFESNRTGSWDIFRQRIDERVPDALVATPKRWEVLPQLSRMASMCCMPPGRPMGTRNRIPYARSCRGWPRAAGETNGPLDEFRCSLRRSGRCVVRTTVNRDYLVYSELDPFEIGRELARTAWLDSSCGIGTCRRTARWWRLPITTRDQPGSVSFVWMPSRLVRPEGETEFAWVGQHCRIDMDCGRSRVVC